VPGYDPWLYDWHVYAAGARDLIDGALYYVPLTSPYPIPVDSFNYPPIAALVVVPLLPFSDFIAGTVWVLLNIAAVAATAVIAVRILQLKEIALWSGAAFCLFSVSPWAQSALVGNNTAVVLLLVATFVLAQANHHRMIAGPVLGLAIAIKVWPATLLVVLIREREWRTALWAIGTSILLIGLSLVWLGGPTAIGPMVRALSTRDSVAPNDVVLGISWLRETVEWWPDWGGYAVAGLLLLIPARGLTGYGLATLAGMAAIPNLWRHYLETIVFGCALIWRGLADREVRQSDDAARLSPANSPSPSNGTEATGQEVSGV
jgi:hypothetical protein